MSRGIKFRVLDWNNKIRYSDKEFEGSLSWLFETEYKQLMQYTGLKDKNGKEIYEGDIVIMPKHYTKDNIFQVVWHFDSWTVSKKTEYDWEFNNGDYYQGSDIDWTDCEVIGNIYQNPELMEKQ